MLPVPDAARVGAERDHAEDSRRWDGMSVHEWSGTYGDYLLAKVSKVFPELVDDVMPTA